MLMAILGSKMKKGENFLSSPPATPSPKKSSTLSLTPSSTAPVAPISGHKRNSTNLGDEEKDSAKKGNTRNSRG
jgi:hypothetical protein